MTQPIRVRLDEAGFRELVAGKVVRLVTTDGTGVELILADIGFDRMELALTDAIGRTTTVTSTLAGDVPVSERVIGGFGSPLDPTKYDP
jgi:hypothetical protein